jgi:hypothetical protein
MMEVKAERITKKEKFGDVELETVYRKARIPVPPDTLRKIAASSTVAEDEKVSGMEDKETDFAILGAAFGYCPEFNPRTVMANDYIVCDQDVAMTLRDGTVIYSDIYRPVNITEKIPCIVSWSYFGKRPGEGMDEWQVIGVPPGTVSRMAKFESSVLVPTGVCSCERRPPRLRTFPGRHQHVRNAGCPGRLRLYRMACNPGMVQR